MDELIDWCGLKVTRESLGELQAALDRITDAECAAWRDFRRTAQLSAKGNNVALTDYSRIGWFENLCLWSCNRCHSVATDRELHDNWHQELAGHSHHNLSIIGGALPTPDESVLRSGGQLKEYGPRPHISTARPDFP